LFKRIASLALVVALGLIVTGAVHDAPSITSYPVIITVLTLIVTVLAVAPVALRPLLEVSPAERHPRSLSQNSLRTVAFCVVWILYAGLLNPLGFVVTSSMAMVASLWIVLGRFSFKGSAAAIAFVLALALLVTTVLFVPVPKGAVDHWIDETIFTLMGRSS
jgi:hypothetical protein